MKVAENARPSIPLTTRTAEVLCTRIKGMEMTVRRLPGTALANQVMRIVVAVHAARRRRNRAMDYGEDRGDPCTHGAYRGLREAGASQYLQS